MVEMQGVPPWSLACEASALVLSYTPIDKNVYKIQYGAFCCAC
jgi:hypothetical protein